MNSKNTSPTEATNSADSIRLLVKLEKPLMAFKNKKRMGISRKTGKLFPFTEKKAKDQMGELESKFVSALKSHAQTISEETAMDGRAPLLTRLLGQSIPFDDCRQQIPEIVVTGVDGEENSVEVIIEVYESHSL